MPFAWRRASPSRKFPPLRSYPEAPCSAAARVGPLSRWRMGGPRSEQWSCCGDPGFSLRFRTDYVRASASSSFRRARSRTAAWFGSDRRQGPRSWPAVERICGPDLWSDPTTPVAPTLKRILTLWSLLFDALGVIVAAGIYIATRTVIQRLGEAAPLSFLLNDLHAPYSRGTQREAAMARGLSRALVNHPEVGHLPQRCSRLFRYASRSLICTTSRRNSGIEGCPVTMPSASASARVSTG